MKNWLFESDWHWPAATCTIEFQVGEISLLKAYRPAEAFPTDHPPGRQSRQDAVENHPIVQPCWARKMCCLPPVVLSANSRSYVAFFRFNTAKYCFDWSIVVGGQSENCRFSRA
jgi:hypothetical protein